MIRHNLDQTSYVPVMNVSTFPSSLSILVEIMELNQEDLLIDIGCIGRYQFGRNCVFEKCSRRIKYSYNVILQDVYRKFKFPICELYHVYGDLKAAFSFCSF